MQEWPPNYVEVFWGLYPRRLDKKKAMAKLEIIRKSGVPFSDIISGVERYTRWLNERTATVWRPAPKWPTTWLNGSCWTDELDSSIDAAPRSAESAFVAGVANVAARYGIQARVEPPVYDTAKFRFIIDRTYGDYPSADELRANDTAPLLKLPIDRK